MVDTILKVESYQIEDDEHAIEMNVEGGHAKVRVTLTPIDDETSRYRSFLIGTGVEKAIVVLRDRIVTSATAVEMRHQWSQMV